MKAVFPTAGICLAYASRSISQATHNILIINVHDESLQAPENVAMCLDDQQSTADDAATFGGASKTWDFTLVFCILLKDISI